MCDEAEKGRHPRTHLFTLRVWCEPSQAPDAEIRIQVQHVLSGETRYFSDWSQLSVYLNDKLAQFNSEFSRNE